MPINNYRCIYGFVFTFEQIWRWFYPNVKYNDEENSGWMIDFIELFDNSFVPHRLEKFYSLLMKQFPNQMKKLSQLTMRRLPHNHSFFLPNENKYSQVAVGIFANIEMEGKDVFFEIFYDKYFDRIEKIGQICPALCQTEWFDLVKPFLVCPDERTDLLDVLDFFSRNDDPKFLLVGDDCGCCN